MIGDGILWDAAEREAEEKGKMLDQWNSLAADHYQVLGENEELRDALKKLTEAALDTLATGVVAGHLDSAVDRAREILQRR